MSESSTSFEVFAAERLQEECALLARAWADCVASEWSGSDRIDPRTLESEDVAAVLRRVADFIAGDEEPKLARDAAVAGTLHALVDAQRSRGAEPQDLVRQMDLLARVLDAACLEWLEAYPGTPSSESVVRVAGRLNRAPILIGEICMEAFAPGGPGGREPLARGGSEFVHMVVHELSSPLNAAMMAAQLLEMGAGASDETRRAAGMVQRNIRRIDAVLRDVRAVALTGRDRDADVRLATFGQVLGAVLAEVGEDLHAAGVRLDVQEPIPALLIDAPRVKVILVNLLRNAARYSDPARAVRWARVGFEPQSGAGDGWWISVSDNGLGIPAADHARVFDRFTRLGPGDAGGSGLGLAIVKQAVEQLGGRIVLKSEPGVGSTFRFSLPDESTTSLADLAAGSSDVGSPAGDA